ncbi:protein ORF12 [Pigeon adenovirus 1]|uniref:Protein ORF12 n=1 Tax=Pigeon adenovirus 1 TaxID=764030 RepID=X5LRL7_9ADEN|nr:protein ORF12 [Pigeon adenovirus 1]CDO33894.1 protein ORF12 [Pigeon adenovirus 1]
MAVYRQDHKGEPLPRDVDQLVHRLCTLRIFSRGEWREHDPDHYQRFERVAPQLLHRAMKRYCEYSLAQLLYQLHSLEGGQAPTGVHSCHLSRLAEREGMHLTQLVAALLRWFDGYGFDTGHDYCNTLYVVGDATTVADGFVERLLRLFFLHVTADLREFDPRVLLAARKVVRLLHFPLVTTAAVFSNPFVNTLLRGEAVRLPEFGQPKIRTVGPYKCIVRLRQLPPLGALPTNARQHVILRFTTSEPCPFLHRELTTYLRRLQHHTRERPVRRCENPFGCLCSETLLDLVCDSCRDCQLSLLGNDSPSSSPD